MGDTAVQNRNICLREAYTPVEEDKVKCMVHGGKCYEEKSETRNVRREAC